MQSRCLGNHGEDLVEGYLGRRGWVIIERNYRTQEGEIDIIAHREKSWKFVEVKTRRGKKSPLGDPLESLHTLKHQRLEKAMYTYLQENNIQEEYSLDVAIVRIGTHKARIIYYPNAFAAHYEI